jgi:hypothetical protein
MYQSFRQAALSRTINSPYFMKSEYSLPCPKEPTKIQVSTAPHPQPAESALQSHSFFKLNYKLNIILPSTPRSSKWLLHFVFPDPHFVCIFYLSYDISFHKSTQNKCRSSTHARSVYLVVR